MSEQAVNTNLSDIEGVVKWFDPRKGFGFIVGPDGQDIFVHYSHIEGEGFRVLQDNTKVRYDAHLTDRGWHATRVSRIDDAVTIRSVTPATTRNPRRT